MNAEEAFVQLSFLLGKGFLFLVVAFLVVFFLSKSSAALLHFWWKGVMLALVVTTMAALFPPLFHFFYEAVPTAQESFSLPSESSLSTTIPESNGAGRESEKELISSFIPIVLLVLWGAGAVVILVRWMLGWTLSRRMIRDSANIEDAFQEVGALWLNTLRECEQLTGARGEGRLLVHPALPSPMVIGGWKSSILIPTHCKDLGAEERKMILNHELIHLRQRDGRIRPLLALLKTIHWPNPLLWFAVRFLKTNEELSVDQQVIELGSEKTAYASLLRDLVSKQQIVSFRLPDSANSMAQPSSVESRVQKILSKNPIRKQPNRIMKATLITTILVVGFLVGGSVIAPSAEPKIEEKAAGKLKIQTWELDEKFLKTFKGAKKEDWEMMLDLNAGEGETFKFDPVKKSLTVQAKGESLKQVERFVEMNSELQAAGDEKANQELAQKLDQIIIPQVSFENLSVAKALEFLEKRSKELDPDKKGVEIILQEEDNMSKINKLELRNVPLRIVIEFTANSAGLKVRRKDGKVVLEK